MKLSPEKYRACGIDPGTDTLGYAIVIMDVDTLKISLEKVDTYFAAKATRKLPDLGDLLGPRTVRLDWHRDNLIEQFKEDKPHTVTVESPFLGRFATAFEALIECRTAIRRAILTYRDSLSMELIDPLSVKKAMGALTPFPKGKKAKKGKRRKKATGKTKEEIKLALMKLKDVDWGDHDLTALDEHSIDAIAVALYRVYIMRDIISKDKSNLKVFRG